MNSGPGVPARIARRQIAPLFSYFHVLPIALAFDVLNPGSDKCLSPAGS